MAKNITKKSDNYSQWYNDIVLNADLAENSAVRGCMVIKPYGFAIWERLQAELDKMFKKTGHMNAYFPLFIPKSFFQRRLIMLMVLQKNVRLLLTTDLKIQKKV